MNLVHQILVVALFALASLAAPRDDEAKVLDCPQEEAGPDDGTDPSWGDSSCDLRPGEPTYNIVNFTLGVNNTDGEDLTSPFAVDFFGFILGDVIVTNVGEKRAFTSDIYVVDYGNNTGFVNTTFEIGAGKIVEVLVVYNGVQEEEDAQVIPRSTEFIV